jgi:predicted dehydrogenase
MTLRLGILGCGAVTRAFHLPAALRCGDELQVAAVVDQNLDLARRLVRDGGLDCRVVDDYRVLPGHVDCVVNALPNHLHHPVTDYFLRHRIAVLSEKPLATTATDAADLVRTAETHGAPLAVAHVTRFFESTALIRRLLEHRRIGEMRSFEYEWGASGGWETESGYELRREQSGGGVLIVNGVHFVDRMLHWFGSVGSLTYADDSWGGNEANALMELECRGPLGSVRGVVKLSKTQVLKNRLRIVGSAGSIEAFDANPRSVTVRLDGTPDVVYEARLTSTSPGDQIGYFEALLRNVARAITASEPLLTSGREALQAVTVIDRCYRQRQPLAEPWMLGRLAQDVVLDVREHVS